MISKDTAKNVLNVALETGADFAEIYLEEVTTNSISMDNGKVDTINSGITYGAGIRLLNKLQSVYGYTNDLSEASLLKLASSLSKSFNEERKLTIDEIVDVPNKGAHKSERLLSEVSKEEKINLLKDASDIMSGYDPRIVRTQVTFADNAKSVTIFNSKGHEHHDFRARGRMFLIAMAAENGLIETASNGPGAQKGMEFFTADIDVKELAKETAKVAITMLGAKECPSGKMPVIMGNGFGGVIFHEACGHGLEASSVSKKLSIFSDKIGEQVASPIVSAIDDGTIENGWGSGNIDDEGNPTQCNVLIKDGILQNYLIDDFNGRRMGREGNGACRRQSYKFEPTSRMSNTFICAGESTVEEIIAATQYGLYAKSLGGGSVNPATGDFNFAVTEGYMVIDGKIAYPVKGATLIGNGGSILKEIDMVGNDLLRGQGMCGAASGSIPADVGEPTIRIREITVGGRGGAM